MGSNLVIVAIPDENDRVWQVSSEKVPHLTLLYLGDSDQVANADQIVQFVEHAADTMLKRFYLSVDRRDTLGADNADVLFFRKGYDVKAVREFRNALLKDTSIKTAYDKATQIEGPWLPHLTLGYPATPAKPIPPNDISRFYDVSFNKIAVWIDNYAGPEFLLKDYWDEGDDEIDEPTVAMDVAMSSINQEQVQAGMAALEHFGVKGMKWGQRKTEQVTTGGRTRMVTPKKAARLDKQWAAKIYSVPGAIDVHNAMSDHFNQRIGTLNDKFKDTDFSKTDWGNSSNWTPREHQYMKAIDKLSTDGYSAAVKEVHGTSPTGKRHAELSPDGESIVVKETQVKHADDVSDVVAVLKITRSNGLITKAEPLAETKDDTMAQTIDLGGEFIEHFGVKGMKWGVRKQDVTSAAKAVSTTASKGAKATIKGAKRAATAIGDANFEASVDSGHARTRVITEGNKNYKKQDLPALNAKPEYQKARKTTYRLTHPRDSTTKAYRKEAMDAYLNQLEKTANSMQNSSKTRQYTIRERGDDLPAQGGNISRYFWDVSSRKIAHAADNHNDTTSVEVIMDKDGFIVDLKPVAVAAANAMAQSAVYGEAFIEGMLHFGIKGMKWGVRKPPPSAVSPTASSRVPHGDKRKTQIQVDGGQNHPAHEDAIKVAEARIKLKKSGPAALSNQELRDVAQRLQLEGQVAVLTSHKGKRFVTQQLQNEGQNLARQGVKKGIKKGALKIGAAALI